MNKLIKYILKECSGNNKCIVISNNKVKYFFFVAEVKIILPSNASAHRNK